MGKLDLESSTSDPMKDSIDRAYWAGKWEWPELLSVTLDSYAKHVSNLQTSASDLERHGTDIYLALACGKAEAEALRALEGRYFPALDEHLIRAGFDKTSRQDVFQQMLMHLCAGPHPRILTYAGRAALSSWLGVSALRFAVNLGTKTLGGTGAAELTFARIVADDTNPEMRVAIERARPLFQLALSTAIDGLPERDRTLLRLCFVDGLSIDAIGNIYGVHRATAARWITQIRQRIFKKVQLVVTRDLGLHDSEFESLAFLIRSELNLSLRRVLGAA